MTTKEKELILKIKALVEKGVGGEKINAEKKLQYYMNKFNISLNDLEELNYKYYRFIITGQNYKYSRKLLMQLSPNTSYYQKGKSIFLRLTAEEFIDLKFKYDFYIKAFEKDLSSFYFAFLSKNDLLIPYTPGEKIELSGEEREMRLKGSLIAQGLDKHEFHKQLKG